MTHILWQALRSGTLASLAMMPFGLLFRLLDLRIGHYGKKVIQALFGELPTPWMQLAVMAEHFLIGWVSALPLLVVLPAWQRNTAISPLWLGAGYGLAYYALLNAWLLPRAFGDALPWSLGWMTIWPSLAVHLVFGWVVAWVVLRTSKQDA